MGDMQNNGDLIQDGMLKRKTLRKRRSQTKEKDEKPILLVTRKRSTIKRVSIDPKAYPYDKV